MIALFDARGCLTGEGLAEVTGSPVGQAPAEAAAHLVSCARCQDRLLGAERKAAPADRSKAAGRPFRNLALVGVALLATLLLLGVTLMTLGPR